MERRLISKEAEGEETEVRREDQDKINRFSRLHQRELALEDELKTAAKTKEDLEDVAGELELADEDELAPYKIGDAFVRLPLEEVQERLQSEVERVQGEVEVLEQRIGEVREEMGGLKVDLYARFGRSINLET